MNTEVEDIKARLSVKEVIGGYVQLTKAGVSWKGLCPFHNEKSPSFVVNEERASWHCFGCNKGGDIFSFVMEMDGLSFPEALSLLAERAGVVLERRGRRFDYQQSGERSPHGETATNDESHDEVIAKEAIFKILDLSSKFFEKQLWDGAGKKTALPYLRGRGLSDESIRTFRLGYALPGWRVLSDFLMGKGYSAEEMEGAGMIIRKGMKNEEWRMKEGGSNTGANNQNGGDFLHSPFPIPHSIYDRFRDRVTFPVLDTSGRVVGFSARVSPGGDESQAKYINTPETMVYHKSRALYGMFLARQAIREKGYALFVEGNMDVIAMHQAGYANTIAVSGTALTEEQLRIVKRYAETIRLFFDMDSAGQKASRKSAEMALALGFSVSIVSLPSGKDAAEMARENAEALHEAVEHSVPAPEYFLRTSLKEYDAKTAEGKRRIAEDVLGLVRLIPKKIEQSHWVHRLSEAIQTKETILLSMLREMKFSPMPIRNRADEISDSPISSSEEAASKTQDVFETRSEKLGRDVAALLLAAPALLPPPLEGAPDRVFDFVARSPILSFLAGETPETFLFSKLPEEMKKEGATLAFAGEKMLQLPETEASENIEKARLFFETTWNHFVEELRKEEMQSLERAMRLAHERGDREEERRLATELVRVGGEK